MNQIKKLNPYIQKIKFIIYIEHVLKHFYTNENIIKFHNINFKWILHIQHFNKRITFFVISNIRNPL